MNVLSIDIGSSTLKSAVIDSNGGVLKSKDINYFDYFSVDFNNFDTNIWIFAFKKAISYYQDLSIDFISIGGISPCLVSLDDELRPIEVFHWNSFKKSKNFKGKSAFLPFVLYTIENNTYDKVKYFVSCFEYIIYLLTGELFTSYPSISYIPFIFNDKEISEKGIDKDKFPKLVRMGEFIGNVNRKASLEFGIASGIKVLNSGSDYLSALIGSGALSDGIVSNRTGTSEGFNFVSDKFLPGFSLQYPYFLDNFFVIGKVLSSGYLLHLWKDSFFTSKDDFSSLFNKLQYLDIKNELYFYPSKDELCSEFFKLDPKINNSLKNGFLGSLENSLELGLSLIEYFGFAFYSRILALKQFGKNISNIFISGSHSDNFVLNQIKANIIGHDIEIFEFKHSELIGSAMLAFTYSKEFINLEEASNALLKVKKIIKPNPSVHEFYKEKYEKYIFNFKLFANS